MRTTVKENVLRRIPAFARGRHPDDIGWAQILAATVAEMLFVAALKAVGLVVLVWIVHTHWWPAVPELEYPVAVAVMVLVRALTLPASWHSETPPPAPGSLAGERRRERGHTVPGGV
ncbi:hypothetical protein [Actinoplanes rectilineatus]|uniref:hypothetical protein n=1 Tax=Actinoplanes rectilineatus TaxID=113571 RepID=UPI0005F2B6CC|nr:hypothetical protein [Actinoplanes rectilineatus]